MTIVASAARASDASADNAPGNDRQRLVIREVVKGDDGDRADL